MPETVWSALATSAGPKVILRAVSKGGVDEVKVVLLVLNFGLRDQKTAARRRPIVPRKKR